MWSRRPRPSPRRAIPTGRHPSPRYRVAGAQISSWRGARSDARSLSAPAAGNGSGGGAARAQIKRPNAPDPNALVPIVKEQHEKVGRNDPCWCGSGKKFKFCHGAA